MMKKFTSLGLPVVIVIAIVALVGAPITLAATNDTTKPAAQQVAIVSQVSDMTNTMAVAQPMIVESQVVANDNANVVAETVVNMRTHRMGVARTVNEDTLKTDFKIVANNSAKNGANTKVANR